MYDLAIVGGGASGMLASILAKRHGLSVCLIESNDRLGKKLLATGNGKCNISNTDISTDFYNSKDIQYIIGQFGVKECIDIFESLGLYTRVKSGRIYPFSEMSSSVLNVLRDNMNGIDVYLNSICTNIIFNTNYIVNTTTGNYVSRKICLATGSNASFGRDSLSIYTKFGHTIVEKMPSLCPILVEDLDKIKGLQGIRANAKLTLIVNGKSIYSEFGEILFKKDSLSGIVSFGISARMSRLKIKKAIVSIDFLNELNDAEKARVMENDDIFINGIFQKNLIANILKFGKHSAVDYRISVAANNDICQAQVISGGLDFSEFDNRTLESKLAKDAYAIGEALDIDGDCGGYNLHWAWASAYAMVKGIIGENNVAKVK